MSYGNILPFKIPHCSIVIIMQNVRPQVAFVRCESQISSRQNLHTYTGYKRSGYAGDGRQGVRWIRGGCLIKIPHSYPHETWQARAPGGAECSEAGVLCHPAEELYRSCVLPTLSDPTPMDRVTLTHFFQPSFFCIIKRSHSECLGTGFTTPTDWIFFLLRLTMKFNLFLIYSFNVLLK